MLWDQACAGAGAVQLTAPWAETESHFEPPKICVGDSRWKQQKGRAVGILASGRGHFCSPVDVSFHLPSVCLVSYLLFEGTTTRSVYWYFSAEFTCWKRNMFIFLPFLLQINHSEFISTVSNVSGLPGNRVQKCQNHMEPCGQWQYWGVCLASRAVFACCAHVPGASCKTHFLFHCYSAPVCS